jgi:uncharacterized protein (TIGR03067 family)
MPSPTDSPGTARRRRPAPFTPEDVVTTLTRAVCLAAAVGLISAISVAQDAEADKKAMQGTWTVLTAVRNGKKRPDDQIAKMKLVIQGDVATIHTGDRGEPARLSLDPSKTPKAVDIRPGKADENKDKEGKAFPGIYEINGDNLKIAWKRDSRPTDFKEEGEGVFLFVLKRSK